VSRSTGGLRAACRGPVLLVLLALVVFPAALPASAPDPERIVARLAEPETRDAARAELLGWIRELPPGRAPLWLHLAASLDRLPAESGLAAARAVLRADGGASEAGAGAMDARRAAGEALGTLALEHPTGEQAVLLALAARILDPVEAGAALFLRRRYLELAGEHLRGWSGPEVAEVVLATAQALLSGVVPAGPWPAGEGPAEAVPPGSEALRILESFLALDPGHPLAPEARRLRGMALAGDGGTAPLEGGGAPGAPNEPPTDPTDPTDAEDPMDPMDPMERNDDA
jgi:hypothetical protein